MYIYTISTTIAESAHIKDLSSAELVTESFDVVRKLLQKRRWIFDIAHLEGAFVLSCAILLN